jgi:hypothetical protein
MLMKIKKIPEVTHDIVENKQVEALRRRAAWRSRGGSSLSTFDFGGRRVAGERPAAGKLKIKKHTNEAVRLLKTKESHFCARLKAVRLLKTRHLVQVKPLGY